MTAGDRARVGVGVALPLQQAFEVFTQQIDLWWRRGPRYRNLGGERAIVALEPHAGGRVFETPGSQGPVHEIGRVLAWQPPHRLLFEWRLSNFAIDERTLPRVQSVRMLQPVVLRASRSRCAWATSASG